MDESLSNWDSGVDGVDLDAAPVAKDPLKDDTDLSSKDDIDFPLIKNEDPLF